MKKRVLSLCVSIAILALLYRAIDPGKIGQIIAQSSVPILVGGLLMFVPLLLATSFRLRLMMPSAAKLPFVEANRLNLIASVLNMILPSKMGDIAKAGFMAKNGHLSGSLALSLVVFEKTCDLAALLLWCAFGLLLHLHGNPAYLLFLIAVLAALGGLLLLIGSRAFASLFFQTLSKILPPRLRPKAATMRSSWLEMHGYFWASPRMLSSVASISILLWFLHLLQIWIFTIAIGAEVPFLSSVALAPLALLAGLLPLTFAGVGTRDAALVLLFKPFMPAAAAATLGLLCTLRYLLPAIVGLPFLSASLLSQSKPKPQGSP